MPLLAISLFLVTASPLAYASTINVTLDPSSRTGTLTSSSTTTLILTYPANSTLSHYLRNYSSSVSYAASFSRTSDGASVLEQSLEEHDYGVHVQSMNVSYSLQATGNATTLVVHKQTDISAILTGVFRERNGTVFADLSWKSYRVSGEMVLNFGDHETDVNLVGSTMNVQLGDHPYIMAAILGLFGTGGLWRSPTLDFSALNSPLSTWTRSYNSITNTTTYSKTIDRESSLNASVDYNGQLFTLSVRSDPSAAVAIQGYAVASGDTLQIQRTPPMLTPVVWVVIGTAVVAALAGAVYLLRRSRSAARKSIPGSIGTMQ